MMLIKLIFQLFVDGMQSRYFLTAFVRGHNWADEIPRNSLAVDIESLKLTPFIFFKGFYLLIHLSTIRSNYLSEIDIRRKYLYPL